MNFLSRITYKAMLENFDNIPFCIALRQATFKATFYYKNLLDATLHDQF